MTEGGGDCFFGDVERSRDGSPRMTRPVGGQAGDGEGATYGAQNLAEMAVEEAIVRAGVGIVEQERLTAIFLDDGSGFRLNLY